MRTLLVTALLISMAPPVADAAPKRTPITIDTAKGSQTFSVEVVKDEADRERGLMYRRHMSKHRGMLFDYDPPQPVTFWMKNTYLSLDIIYIGPDGRILNIAENAKPLSLDELPSAGAIRGVLEINGGLSAKLGIKPGDKVHHKLFDPK